MEYVYHGSNISRLKVIEKRKSTHQKEWVYATPSKALAVIFMGRGSDLYYFLGGRGTEESPIVLVERKPNMFKEIFDLPGSLYYLDSKNFLSNKTGWSAEVVSNQNEQVIKEEYIDNVYDKLIELSNDNNFKLYLYPNRPEYVPLDNSDLIPKIKNWEEKGFDISKFFKLYPELEEKYYTNNKSR